MPARNDFVPGEFCWIDLSAKDLESAGRWYSETFGWRLQMMETPGGGPPYGFFMKGDAAVAGIGELTPEMQEQGVPPMWNSYIATADCEATEAKVKELGGTVTVPTMDVPGHGKLMYFLDPEGASIAVWQAAAESKTDFLVKEPGSLSWNELMTRDPSKAMPFYQELIGWDYAAMPMEGVDYTVIKVKDQDAGGIMPMAGPQFDGIPAHWLIYFDVEDCEAATQKAAANGGNVMVPTTEIPVGRFSVVSDPQGAAFALITLNPQG